MTRDEFREAVFARDNYKCIYCGLPAVDAHHILERRLWPEGGYIPDNGVSLCARCHLLAEQTILEVESLRELANLKKVVPPHLEMDERYDKWGNIFLASGLRAPGELFWDESVQKILAPLIASGQFTHYMKYPRTLHVPWSPGSTDDDRVLTTMEHFEGQRVVVTEKLDGENTTLYRDHIHARSIDSKGHPSRSWVKNLHGKIAHEIPEGFRICGENLQAKHAIAYSNLPSFFLVFSIWDGQRCLSWEETEEYAELLGLSTVPMIYQGLWVQMKPWVQAMKGAGATPRYSKEIEGWVARKEGSFTYREFQSSVAKYVRANHVNSGTQHWFAREMEENKLA